MSKYKSLLPLLSWFFGCLAFSGLMHAQEQALPAPMSKPLSISELLDIALQNNPDTRTAWWNARRAASAADLTTSAYYPNIQFVGDASHGREYQFPNGNETTYSQIAGGIFLTYLLYDFGERQATSEAAKAALCAANWQTDQTLQEVMYSVLDNVYSYLNSQEILFSQLQSLNDALISLEAVEELNRVGLRSVTDLYTIKATVTDMKMEIALQRADTDISRGKLAASLGLDVDSNLQVAQLPAPVPDFTMKEGLSSLISIAQQQRADLIAKHASIAEKVAIAKQTKASYLPKINFNADSGYQRYLHDRSNGYNYNVGLSLTVPLFEGFESIYANRVAYSNVQISESELERLQLDIALEVLSYSRLVIASQELLKLAGENLENSLKSFQGVLDKYKAGTQSIFDLTAAQKQLADARIKHGDAKTRWYRSIAQLAYATGSISPYTEVPCVSSP